MDGIPVKISEKYKPPRKFILPGCILNKINSDIKIEPYNFNLERSVLQHLTQLKEAKRKHYERKLLKRDEWLSKVKVKDPPENESCPLDISSQVPPESTMLTPVPISSNSRIEPIRQEGQINLSDFENDTSSPFDNVELKTINEMEELAHVLGGTTLENTSFHSLKKPVNSSVHLPNGYTSHHWDTANTYNYQGIYGSNNGTGNGGTAINLPSSHISSGPYNYIGSTNESLFCHNSAYNSTVGSHLPHASYNVTQNNTALRHDDYADRNFRHNSYLPPGNLPSIITQLPHDNSATHTYPSSSKNTLQNTYKSYIPYIPSASSAVNLHLPSTSSSLPQETVVNLSNNTSPLPKKKEDNGIFQILGELKKDVLLRKHEIRPLPPNPVYEDIIRPSLFSSSKHGENELVNPLSHLNLQCQEFAKNMAEMGFPLARVARATQQFGTDEAKVIEFLLQVQLLEEKHYPEEQIEKALIAHNFKEDEAASYLENLNQIMKLGFKEEEVEKALSKSSNNRDKALDILIS